jgi:NAD(P)-dependent dehydrogenase (short-subunit alcohol dehydrogenase family)
MTNLNGKVAVVLGASAEAGTGWAVAEAFSRAGAKVVVAARSLMPLKRLAERIGGLACRCDAGEEQDVAALADAALAAFGRVDIGVNLAGFPVLARLQDVTPEQLLDGVKVNYFGQVYFFKHMARVMADGGSIVAISSISSTDINGHFFPYACGKAATNCLVKYAAAELGPRGIRVNAILPGPIRSEMTKQLFAIPGMEQALSREIPLRRIGEPADFADACLWLAGSAYVTGESLQINGGMHLNRFPYPDEVPGGGYPFYSPGDMAGTNSP